MLLPLYTCTLKKKIPRQKALAHTRTTAAYNIVSPLTDQHQESDASYFAVASSKPM